MAGDLWKPYGEHTGNLVYLSSKDFGGQIYVVDAKTGEVLDTGKFDKKYEDGRYIYRFNKPGSSFSDVVLISQNGDHTYIPDGSKRYENLSYSQAQKNTSGKEGIPKYDPATFSTTLSEGAVTKEAANSLSANDIPHIGNVALVNLLDPNALSFQRTELEFTDPIETLRAIAKENKGQISENYLMSLQQAGQLSEANKNQLVDYLNTMSPLQLQMVGIENAFNQQQKLQTAEAAQPGITDLLRGEVKNAQTLASGRLLKDSEDRALELTARSAGADAAWTRGLGDDSLVGKRLSDQLSVSQRLQVMQAGQNYMNTAVQLANQTLMDTPNKAGLSQQIAGTPKNSFSEISGQQQGLRNDKTTLDAAAGMNAFVSVQKDFNDTLLQVNAANTQAINKFNQDVINDQMATQAAEAKKLALQQASFAKEHGLIDEDEYKKILAEIELTGTIDMDAWSKDFKYYWEKYQQDRIYGEGKGPEDYSESSGNKTPTDITSPTGGSEGAGGSQGGTAGGETGSGGSGGSGGEEETQESYNKTLSLTSMLANSTAKSGQDPTRIVQENGIITPFIQIPYDFSTLNSSDYLMGFLDKLLNGEYSSGVNND